MSKFKVGDAVVPAAGDRHGLFNHWMEYWAKDGDVRPTKFYVVGFSDQFVVYNADRNAKDGPHIPERDLQLAQKFAVGDKVRVVESVGVADIGATATIGPRGYWTSKFGSQFIDIVWDDLRANGQMNGGYYPTAFEHAPSYTSCAAAEVDNLADEYGAPRAKFKVGDRVRWKEDYGDHKKGDIVTVSSVRDDMVGTDTHHLAFAYRFEHVTAPTAALRIEAGKLYKTRDGRKVGPMEAADSDYWRHEVKWSCGSRGWYAAGNYWTDGESENDLIAEWTDEPVAAPAAKFKVGDKLTKRNGYWREEGYEVKKIEGDRVYLDDTFGGSVSYKANDEELVIVSPTTTIADIVARHSESGTAIVAVLENGQPRPATRPYVHTSTGAAETEANRLARTNPGKEFGVYTLGTVAKVGRVYEHEWQRLAAEGSLFGAANALKKLSGIDYDTAYKAATEVFNKAA